MIEAVIVGILNYYVGLMGLLFLILIAFNNRGSWILLICGHGIWFGYTLFSPTIPVDYYSLIISILCLVGLNLHDEVISFEDNQYKLLYFILCVMLSVVLGDTISSIIDNLAMMLTVVGVLLLSIKFIDGWIFIGISCLFSFQNTALYTILAILIAVGVCTYGYYRWNKIYNNKNIQLHTMDGDNL